MLNPNEVKAVLETALLANQSPLSIADLRRMFDEEIGPDTLRRLLDELRDDWRARAVLEPLAITAYRQPVSRGDIEDIRGVTVSPNIIRALEQRGWIDVVGYR